MEKKYKDFGAHNHQIKVNMERLHYVNTLSINDTNHKNEDEKKSNDESFNKDEVDDESGNENILNKTMEEVLQMPSLDVYNDSDM